MGEMNQSTSADRPRRDPRGTAVEADLASAPLSRLLEIMRTGGPDQVEVAWAECFRQYHDRVWHRVFFVLRTVHWLKEPREVAADVAGQVFLGLPDAVRKYREVGKAEQWLLQVAMRTALRHKESITGKWSSGKKKGSADGASPGRAYLGLDDLVHELGDAADAAETDERLELWRRLDGWQNDASKRKYLPYIDLFIQGYNHEEIAEKLDITPGTSRTWLWKIRQHLAEGLEGEVSRHGEEIAGRDADQAVISILPRLDRHPEAAALQRYADAALDEGQSEQVERHVAGCEVCAGTVYALRLGLAILATASRPPEGLFELVQQRRRAGERVMLPLAGGSVADGVESSESEVVGRDADAPTATGEEDASDR